MLREGLPSHDGGYGVGSCLRSFSSHTFRVADPFRKIFDFMDTETEPTDEQLAELMHYVGEAVRAESIRIEERLRNRAVQSVAEKPASRLS